MTKNHSWKVREYIFGLGLTTLNHVSASLAAGWPTEDVLLETVSLDRLHRLGLRLWLRFGGHGQRGTDRG